MKEAGDRYGLKTLTEVMDSAHCELVHSYVDGLQVGARNFQNFSLLKKIGQVTAESKKMVLYKRGFAGTIAEWLAATDYLTAEGNDNVVLCERGIRTFETATRFTLDIAAVPVIHKQSLYPVCIDVSHPAGQRDLVPSLAFAAVAAGADSLIDRGAPQPALRPVRRPPAAHAHAVREARGPAAESWRRCSARPSPEVFQGESPRPRCAFPQGGEALGSPRLSYVVLRAPGRRERLILLSYFSVDGDFFWGEAVKIGLAARFARFPHPHNSFSKSGQRTLALWDEGIRRVRDG